MTSDVKSGQQFFEVFMMFLQAWCIGKAGASKDTTVDPAAIRGLGTT
jgi:hypothetical protein